MRRSGVVTQKGAQMEFDDSTEARTQLMVHDVRGLAMLLSSSFNVIVSSRKISIVGSHSRSRVFSDQAALPRRTHCLHKAAGPTPTQCSRCEVLLCCVGTTCSNKLPGTLGLGTVGARFARVPGGFCRQSLLTNSGRWSLQAMVCPVKDPTSVMAQIARKGSVLLRDVREKNDRDKSKNKFWELAGPTTAAAHSSSRHAAGCMSMYVCAQGYLAPRVCALSA